MPNYIFKNPTTGETIEVFQNMNDPHIYFKDGTEWSRVFTVPKASIDTNIDPMSHRDWNLKTENKRGTIGDMMDRSKELSEQREKIMGQDLVKQKFFDDHRKKSRGRYHPDDPRPKQQAKEKLSKMGVEVTND